MDIHLARSGLVLAAGLVLAGCGVYDSMHESLLGKDVPPVCPRVSVLPEAASLTKFLPGLGRDIIDIVYQGEIRDILISCENDIDDDTNTGTVAVKLLLQIGAERGAADRDRRADFTYFVAITGGEMSVLNKRTFDGAVEFPGNVSRLTWTDDKPVTLNIPLKAGQSGSDFEIFVGFQLSREEMEFNSRRRARTP
jgi:hypothetical protein